MTVALLVVAIAFALGAIAASRALWYESTDFFCMWQGARLISGGADPVSAYVRGAGPALREQIIPLLREVDPLRWIRQARPGTIFFQDGKRDEIVPRESLLALIRAAPKPQRVAWYDTGHSPNGPEQTDAVIWLTSRLRAK